MQVVQVDDIGLQALQRGLACGLERGGAAINDAHFLPIAFHVHAGHAALAGQREAVAVLGQHFAHQRLVGTKAIQRGGVKVGHARVQRGQQHALALLGGHGRAIGVAQVHAAQPNGRHLKRPQRTLRQCDVCLDTHF